MTFISSSYIIILNNSRSFSLCLLTLCSAFVKFIYQIKFPLKTRKMHGIILLVIVATLQFTAIKSQSAPIPRIKFYSATGCRGDLVREDQGDTSFPLGLYRFASYNITELWVIQPCNSTNRDECEFLLPRKAIGICINEDFGNYTQLHLRRRSDNLVEDKINFYSGPRLNGTHDSLTTDINSKTLRFESFFFTGNYSWTIYTETDYTGRSYCVETDDDVRRNGYGVTLRTHIMNMTLKSLRKGCHGDEVLPTEVPGRETTTTTEKGGEGNGASTVVVVGYVGIVTGLIILLNDVLY